MPKSKQTIEIKCTFCGYNGNPIKWWPRLIVGIIMLPLAFFPAIFYFVFSNPYCCPKCYKRNRLNKIIDGKEIRIKSLGKLPFTLIVFLLLIILFLLVFMKLAIYLMESEVI
jgi:hypothetical protein